MSEEKYWKISDRTVLMRCCDEIMFEYICVSCGEKGGCYFCEFDLDQPCECKNKKITNPQMYYWTKDNLGHEWRILLVGEYEMFEDGDAIVSELDVAEYCLDGKIYTPTDVPDEITGFADSLLDSKDTYIDIQREYEKGLTDE